MGRCPSTTIKSRVRFDYGHLGARTGCLPGRYAVTKGAAIMSLTPSERMNGHDPYAYLNDVLTRLPTHHASEIGQLLPRQWMPA